MIFTLIQFQYYNKWLSLLTGIMSIASMIFMSLPLAIITIAIILFFYLLVLYRKPGKKSQVSHYYTLILQKDI